ncbi:hypothetical protein DEDE109153_02575 [Deinococcus deserti]
MVTTPSCMLVATDQTSLVQSEKASDHSARLPGTEGGRHKVDFA